MIIDYATAPPKKPQATKKPVDIVESVTVRDIKSHVDDESMGDSEFMSREFIVEVDDDSFEIDLTDDAA